VPKGPTLSGGRKSKLTDEQMKELRTLLEKEITGLQEKFWS